MKGASHVIQSNPRNSSSKISVGAIIDSGSESFYDLPQKSEEKVPGSRLVGG